MAKKRYITTEFWRDNFIDELDPVEKLLFIYLLCNPSTNLCGIYQAPLRIIASDTGIDSRAIENIFNKLAEKKKAYYIDGWVVLPNAPKHQEIRNEKIQKGIERELSEVNKEVLMKVHSLSIPYIYPIDETLYLTKPNLTKPNLTKPNGAEQSSDDNHLLIIKILEKFTKIVNPNCKRYYGNKTQRSACEDLIESYGFKEVMKVIDLLPQIKGMKYIPTITTPLQLRDKYEQLKTALLREKATQEDKKNKYKVI